MAKKKPKEEVCEFEVYDKKVGGMVICGEKAEFVSLKRNKFLCSEHGEYAKMYLGKYDVVPLQEVRDGKHK